VRHLEHVLHDDASGNTHVLGISAIVEEKIFAKIFLATAAMKAAEARRGIRRNHAEADPPPRVDSLPDRSDFAYDFVPENRRRLDHLRVISTLPNFQIGAIREGKADSKQDFVSGKRRDVDFFKAQVLAPVKHGGHHL
jgi:hypothetical protein